jgi:hypothetical protein
MKTSRMSPRLLVLLVLLVALLGLGSSGVHAQGAAPSEKVVNAYSQYVCFVLFEVASGTPAERQACQKEVGEALVQSYPRMSAEERAQLEQIPAEWATLRESWANLDESERDMVRAQWALMLQAELDGGDTAVGGAGQEKP